MTGNTIETPTLAHIAAQVDAAPNGLLRTTLEPLRDAIGWEKLSKRALGIIEDALEEAGLTPLGARDLLDPTVNVEPRHWHEVWLVRSNSNAGRIARAVLHPDDEPDVAAAFAGIAPTSPAEAKLEAIRKIVLEG